MTKIKIPKMRWAQTQRMKFIDGRSQEKGHINRKDICDYFGVSTPQASTDIQMFIKSNPRILTYDLSKKTYVRNP